jgi:hypothetical protein
MVRLCSWFKRFTEKFRKDPDFLTRDKDKL